ncbi:MAG TPA: glycosyltransferase family 2 protein, partial [bacterium]|nr:glycosyltransferase family 2 protein [bacterium]
METGKPDPPVTVVIPHLAGDRWLGECLEALRRQSFSDFRTVLVDNASGDGSSARARERYPGVDVVRNAENLGFAGACEEGRLRTRSPLLVFLNDDVVLGREWMERMVAAMEAHPETAAAAGKLVQAHNPQRISSAGNLVLPSGFGRDRGVGEPDGGRFDLPAEVFWASGAACMIRRRVLDECGGWDRSFFAYFEDIDLGLRARLRGHVCSYVPEAAGRHRGGATAAGFPRLASELLFRNAAAVAVKNFPGRVLGRRLPSVLGAHARALLYLTLK